MRAREREQSNDEGEREPRERGTHGGSWAHGAQRGEQEQEQEQRRGRERARATGTTPKHRNSESEYRHRSTEARRANDTAQHHSCTFEINSFSILFGC